MATLITRYNNGRKTCSMMRRNAMDVKMYDTQAAAIDVDNIAQNSNNRIILRRIKRNDEDDFESRTLYIQNHHSGYCPEGANDMGWLGYFIGKNDHLKQLVINPFTPTSTASVRDVVEPFFRGISCNKSIQIIRFNNMDILGGDMFTMLGPFFQNNHNLTNIIINNCDFGDEGCRLFALAIGSRTNQYLQKVMLNDNSIADEGMVDIITALSIHHHLHHLDLDGNCLRKNGCVALSTLLQCSAIVLQYLNLSNNEIGDDGVEALVPALPNCICLRKLWMCNNRSITTRGWQSLASILEAPNSKLDCLDVEGNNVDDEAVAAFANALTNNHILQTLDLDINPSITAVGWEAFSNTLCNTSSVNATFLSNHTLQYTTANPNAIIEPLLDLNERDDKKEVAVIKILQNHDDFDMLPFFEWEFKILPLVISWLERASEYEMPRGFEPNIEERKLSTIYQFVRGMPVLYVETRLRKELEDIKAEQSQMEEQLQEFQQRMQLLQNRNEWLEERKKSILKKIGKPN